HEEPQRLREHGGQAARVADLASGDDEAQGPQIYVPARMPGAFAGLHIPWLGDPSSRPCRDRARAAERGRDRHRRAKPGYAGKGSYATTFHATPPNPGGKPNTV